MILRARTVVTMDGPPIENGAVAIAEGRICAVGPLEEVRQLHAGHVIDLGEQVLLPGLINAHCHLDYTMMRKAISKPKSFAKWIERLNALKRSLDVSDYVCAIEDGFAELKKWGTTTVLNIEAIPEVMPLLEAPPIRTWWFYEMIDVRQRVATEELVAGALSFFRERPDWLGGFGLSPHAPYTASDELYRLAGECARVTGMPLSTHVAESVEEEAMFRQAAGPLYDFMRALGRDMSDCGERPALTRLLEDGLLGEEWIVVHGNEIAEGEFALLAGRRFNLVHCPCSHRYFSHRPFAFRRLHGLGVNIALGTDSLASNDALNLFQEMQIVAQRETWLPPRGLLATVTTNAARALQMEDRLGKIAPGAYADLICVPFAGDVSAVYETIVHHQEPIRWLMVDGAVAG